MAKKKKKQKREKAAAVVEREPNMFLRSTMAIVMIVLGLLLFLGMLGVGGGLPVTMFEAVYWLIGWAGYTAPFILVYWAVHKFKHEEKIVPKSKLVIFSLFFVFFSAFWHVIGVKNADASISGTETTLLGGHFGEIIGKMLLTLFDRSICIGVLALTNIILFMWGIKFNPLSLLKKKELEEEEEESGSRSRVTESGIRINTVDDNVEEEPRLGRRASLKGSTPKTAKDEGKALTVRDDGNWKYPDVTLLETKTEKANPGSVEQNAATMRETFSNFNMEVEMDEVFVGPRLTQYTMKPPAGIKLSRITALENNVALDLGAQSIRIEAPIPGKKVVGIEVPNVKAATVRIAGLLMSKEWAKSEHHLSFVVGRDIAGIPVVAAIEKMPHLLVAGQTASGKSVMINTLITSLLYRNPPSDLKMILVDPKHVELSVYNDIPHLLTPVITDPEKCISALKWSVSEMERRYKLLASKGKRNIAEYNSWVDIQIAKSKDPVFDENGEELRGMPFIVIVIDELADLMMMAARDVEALIVRIAQKARAVGIHLVLATQRPSVDVITGIIKANVPARIAFTVASQVDSRTIIDQVGAEKLLGMGDMLFNTADMPKPRRVQGALITTEETQRVTDFLRSQASPDFNDDIISQPVQIGNSKGGAVIDFSNSDGSEDSAFKDAVKLVVESKKASSSMLIRRLGIGYGRASRLIDIMEDKGIVSAQNGSKPREVLISSIDEIDL